MMRWLTAVLLASLSVGSVASGQHGVNPALQHASRIWIIVDHFEADAIRIGFDTSAVRKQVEAALHEQRIAAMPIADSAAGFLYVNVDAATIPGSGVSAANITIQFWAPVTVDRPPHGSLVATAWDTNALFIAADAEWPSKIHADIATQLDKFMEAWRSSNPPSYQK